MRSRPKLTIFKFAVAITAALLLVTTAIAGHHGAEKKDIVDTAVANGNFSTLAAARQAGRVLIETLRSDGPFTVFAPTDDAFENLPDDTVEMLLLPENKDKLVAILTYQVVAGEVGAAEVVKLDSASTVNGSDVQITVLDGNVMINDSRVEMTDIYASNGVIHVVDTDISPNRLTVNCYPEHTCCGVCKNGRPQV